MTMQRSSGRTRVCGPAGKGPMNINSSTVHSSKSSVFKILSLFMHLYAAYVFHILEIQHISNGSLLFPRIGVMMVVTIDYLA